MKTLFTRLLFVSALLLAAAPLTQAQDLNALRGRMEKRISSIDALKTQGVLGENNRGFLEVRSGDDQGVAAAENADRSVVYAAIAQKTGSTADAVGKARAKQIAGASAKGVWVQAENGSWAQK
ncbi:YdbL family protein [Rariglobus hedericola]|uniref:DUF1318 domain-containing protein n=1 Tax=Rariglobus hedericola TaxID=2597822 RepID=A0A556QQL7_9BACT|nr:DUF1318 domain-containing protein [Rariglobus hedericola]TSJ78937.1 DUF1318 domain-containing protein [Rariglobus hedericola]